MAEEYEYRASLTLIYFGMGFVAAAGPTAMLATFLRPYILAGPQAFHAVAMLAPLALGVLFGARTSAGAKDRLSLFGALRRAFFLGSG